MAWIDQAIGSAKDYGRRLWQWFLALSFWKRALISSFLGAFAGSTILGFINRYALFYYCYTQEIRIPVEGVPYLDLAVSLLSFAFIALALISTFVVHGVWIYFANSIRVITDNAPVHVRWIKIILTVAAAIAIVYSLFIDWPREDGPIAIRSILYFSVHTVALIVLSVEAILASLSLSQAGRLSKNNVNLRLVAVGCTVGIGILGIVVALFQPGFYSAFLREIKFGGGLPVEVEYRSGDNSKESLSGHLFVSTNEGVFLRDEYGSRAEIPRERISKITYLPDYVITYGSPSGGGGSGPGGSEESSSFLADEMDSKLVPAKEKGDGEEASIEDEESDAVE